MAPRKNRKRRIHPWYHPVLTGLSRGRALLERLAVRTGPSIRKTASFASERARVGISLIRRISTRVLPVLRPMTRAVWRRISPKIMTVVQYFDPRIVRLENPDRHRLHTAVISSTMLGILILAGTLAACS